MHKQQLIAAHNLSVLRAAEARLGLASVLHYFQPLARFPQLGGTPAKRHHSAKVVGLDGVTVIQESRGHRYRNSRAISNEKVARQHGYA